MEINKAPLKRTNFAPADSVGSKTDSCTSTDEVITETSESLDSSRNERKLEQRKQEENKGPTWGSLVHVMYGLEDEKVMKLGPDHFNRNRQATFKSQETAKRRGLRRGAVTLKHIELPEQKSESDDFRGSHEAISISEILKQKVESRNQNRSPSN